MSGRRAVLPAVTIAAAACCPADAAARVERPGGRDGEHEARPGGGHASGVRSAGRPERLHGLLPPHTLPTPRPPPRARSGRGRRCPGGVRRALQRHGRRGHPPRRIRRSSTSRRRSTRASARSTTPTPAATVTRTRSPVAAARSPSFAPATATRRGSSSSPRFGSAAERPSSPVARSINDKAICPSGASRTSTLRSICPTARTSGRSVSISLSATATSRRSRTSS